MGALAALAAAGGLAALLLGAAERPGGYLGGQVVDLAAVLPPPPRPGDLRFDMDRRVFRAGRRFVATPRWAAAIRDVDGSPDALERDFSCAAGLALTPARFPALTRLLAQAAADTGRANSRAKDGWRRQRPFRLDHGQTCEDQRELADSFDYPSGHTTRGWTFGLVLADVLPDRAAPLLARARAYGESRLVCRVHNYSAVENGRLGATVTMASVRQTPGYLADLAAARAEVAAARTGATPPDGAACAADERLLTPSVLADLRR